MQHFLIPLSVAALLFVGLQENHLSPTDKISDTLIKVSFSNNDHAILPASIKLLSVDFYSLPEVLHYISWSTNNSIDVVQSLFVNAYCRNVYYVLISIHAP